MRNVPNALTFLRLALVPVFVALMIDPSRQAVAFATGIFIFAALTDFFDGWIARRYGVASNFGKMLDPLADKLLVMAALVMLVAQRSDFDGAPWVPAWMVVVVLAREIWITGLRSIAAEGGQYIGAGSAGKIKAWLQMVAIVFLLMHGRIVLAGTVVDAQLWGMRLLFVSILFSVFSAVEYTSAVFSNQKAKA